LYQAQLNEKEEQLYIRELEEQERQGQNDDTPPFLMASKTTPTEDRWFGVTRFLPYISHPKGLRGRNMKEI